MSTPAPKPVMRYGELLEWLQENGIGKWRVRKLFKAGVIKSHVLPACGRALYNADQVQRDVIDKLGG